jgi:hypothetical protein
LLFADGPPVDSTGKITTKYISLHLDSSQIIQVSRAWAFELNETQQKILKKINNKAEIKILDIITFPYFDCSCGMYMFGIWFKKDSVGIPLEYIKEYHLTLKSIKEDEGLSTYKYYKSRTFKDVIKKLRPENIFIDWDGKYYLQYKEISEKYIFQLIDKFSEKNIKIKNNSNYYVFFQTAPLISKKIKKMMLEKILKFKEYCDKKEVGCGSLIVSY